MRHRIIVAALLVFTVVGTVAAQDYIYTHFGNGYQDRLLPPSPCDQTLDAIPVVYDRSIWVFYRCSSGAHGGNGIVYARRFHHPNDNAVPPVKAPEEVAVQMPVNPMGTIACPGTHKACGVLPAGEYPLTWADTVAR